LGTYLFDAPDFNRAWKFKGVNLDIKKQEGKKSNLGVMNKNRKTEKKLKN
jgi:hypothetical protein